ncbi:MAG: glycosyltransferase [Prolixibacteraceae bacterium]|nr:glycosyltransferase [Prolixibacteraceae bacterium]
MKRALIITYYWPPAGGGGVMRWLKMSKYLPEQGWQPVIYTPENPDPSVIDKSLSDEIHPATEVLNTRIWEPYDLYRKLTGKSKDTAFKPGYISEAARRGWKDRLSVFLRGNFMIPDPRVFWVKPSVQFLKKYLRQHPVDLIITTGPPQSIHLIGLKLKKILGIPWLADFRDPWTEIDFYRRLKLTHWADKKHHRLEKAVLGNADVVTTVSPWLKQNTEKIAGRNVDVIYNGFDPADYEFEAPLEQDKFTIAHFGTFHIDQNPPAFWKALRQAKTENPDFAKKLNIRLMGQTDGSVIENIKTEGLAEHIELHDHLPHMEGLPLLKKSAALLLPLNNATDVMGILPGKMFEYMAVKRPIIAIGPYEADFAGIINSTKTGSVHDFDEQDKMKATILTLFEQFEAGKLAVDSRGYEKFSRRNLAHEIINLPFKNSSASQNN